MRNATVKRCVIVGFAIIAYRKAFVPCITFMS
jgi:hypothetical protein